MQRLRLKDLLLGGLFAAFGLVYGITTLRELPIGEAFNMGPGFFPAILSALLSVIGAVIAFQGLFAALAPDNFGTFAWRGVAAISLATIVFSVTAWGAGLVVAVIATSLVASLASSRSTVLSSVATALVLAAVCSAIFVYGLKLPIGLFGTWFG